MRIPLAFKVTETGCYEVISHRPGVNGYPQLWIDGKPKNAHRHIWEECFGSIPEGLCVCHKCDNRLCVNPEHLFIGEHSDNVADKVAKGRQLKGIDIAQSILTEKDVIVIRNRYRFRDKTNGRNVIAKEYGVAPATIYHVIHRDTWGWL